MIAGSCLALIGLKWAGQLQRNAAARVAKLRETALHMEVRMYPNIFEFVRSCLTGHVLVTFRLIAL